MRAGLRAATFRYVEQQLFDYAQLKARLSELDHDIVERGAGIAYDEQSHHREASPEWSDPTPRRAGQLLTHRARGELANAVHAIRLIYASASALQQRVTERYYWKREEQWRVAKHLTVSERSVARARQAVVAAVAEEMGLW
jgi:RinA family phage transcriptional activator